MLFIKFALIQFLFLITLVGCNERRDLAHRSVLVIANVNSMGLMYYADLIEADTGVRNLDLAIEGYVGNNYKPSFSNGITVLFVGVTKRTDLKNIGSFIMLYEYEQSLYCVSRKFAGEKAVGEEITDKKFESIKLGCKEIIYIK